MAVAARESSRRLQVIPNTVTKFSKFVVDERSCSLNKWRTTIIFPFNHMNATFLVQALSSDDRKKILLDVADALEANEELVKIENQLDVAAAEENGYDKPLIARLSLKPGKARYILPFPLLISALYLSSVYVCLTNVSMNLVLKVFMIFIFYFNF